MNTAFAIAQRMARGRRGEAAQMQAEINTQEEWDQMCEKEGLTVVDVYSEWCGPCLAMANNLKKLKLELGDDLLNYAMAKSDNINSLRQFRGKSQPTWLFIGGGVPVALLLGADAPLLIRTIQQELDKERQVLQGKAQRQVFSLETAQPSPDTEEENEKEMEEDEEAVKALNVMRARSGSRLLHSLKLYTVGVLQPYLSAEDTRNSVLAAIEESGFEVSEKREHTLSEAEVTELFKDRGLEEAAMKDMVNLFTEDTALVFVVKGEGDVTESFQGLLGPEDVETAKSEAPQSLRAIYGIDHQQNGLWCPISDKEKSRVMQLLFQDLVSSLQPSLDDLQKRMLMVFPAEKKEEVLAKAVELETDILDQAEMQVDVDKAETLCASQEDRETVQATVDNLTSGPVLALLVRKRNSNEILSLKMLEPLHASPDIEQGNKDAQLFFPDYTQDSTITCKPSDFPQEEE